MPGVTIKITNEVTTAGIEGVSDAEGRYQAGPLIAGPYRVEAMLDGFEPVLRRVAIDDAETTAIELTLHPSRLSESVVVTARRVEEVAQEVPIPVSVVSGALAAATGSFNVNRLKELIPTVQFYSSNPRNTAINIRGLGAPFGLTNDGIDPGVGFYIDGVYYARPAAATLDFIDLERTEVLRGPQGTLYGKNTTAGAINITTRKPTFAPESRIELTFGGLDLVQAKASASGPLSQTVAARLSFSGTTRRGTIGHVGTGEDLNGLNNLGFRGQVLYTPSSKTAVTLSADSTRQRPRGYVQVVAGVAPTERVASRQYAQIAADLQVQPAELQRLRSAERRRHSAPRRSNSRRRLGDDRTDARRRSPDVDHRLALLGLGPVERSRLPRAAGDHHLGESLDTAAVDAGGALLRQCWARHRRRRRRVPFSPDD